MSKLEKAGIIIGHTVTETMIAKAAKADLPDAAMVQLWPKRTLNRAAMAAINKATKGQPAKPPTPAKDKTETNK